MKKYLLSGPKFIGEVEIIYSDVILSIDFSRTDLPPQQRLWILARLPPVEHLFDQFSKNYPSLQVISEELEVAFEDWWKLYDEKFNKERTLKLWEKLSKSERVAAWLGLIRYNRFLMKNRWQNKANPTTFIRNKYWNNEYK